MLQLNITIMLNLYQYHTQPQTLAHYEEARTRVPEMAY